MRCGYPIMLKSPNTAWRTTNYHADTRPAYTIAQYSPITRTVGPSILNSDSGTASASAAAPITAQPLLTAAASVRGMLLRKQAHSSAGNGLAMCCDACAHAPNSTYRSALQLLLIQALLETQPLAGYVAPGTGAGRWVVTGSKFTAAPTCSCAMS